MLSVYFMPDLVWGLKERNLVLVLMLGIIPLVGNIT